MSDNEWYDNKELYEMLNGLKNDLQDTRRIIQKYNGLRETQGEIQKDISKLKKWKQEQKGNKEGRIDAAYWLKWVVILLLSVSNLLALWGVI